MAKRQREMAKQEKHREKAAKKAQRALDKKNGVVPPEDVPEGAPTVVDEAPTAPA